MLDFMVVLVKLFYIDCDRVLSQSPWREIFDPSGSNISQVSRYTISQTLIDI